MGIAKAELMEAEARGYLPSDKYVCAECFRDVFLKKYIRNNGTRRGCDFCKSEDDKPAVRNCVPLNDIMPMIMTAINSEYVPALENAIYRGNVATYAHFNSPIITCFLRFLSRT